MSNIPESDIYNVLYKIALTCDLKEWSHKLQTFETIAQNYFGILIPTTLEGKQNGTHVTIHLVLKMAPPNKMYRISGAVTIFFAREIFVYSDLLHKYRELQDKVPPEYHYVMPKCYFVSKEFCKEVIAMTNMCTEGYSPYTRSRFLDLDHVLVAVKSLAKFHALSYILKDNDSKMFDQAKNECIPLTNNSNSRYITILIDRLEKALHKFENTVYVPLLEILKTNCSYFIESAIYRVRTVCLCHGDIWKENILFKYKDNIPISACIIDYQTTRMSTPAFDILYLILSSVDTSLRNIHFYNLINTYYETFQLILLNFHLDPKQFYSKDDLEYDLSIVGPACFVVANTAIWLSSGLQEEGHVRSKYQPSTDEEKLKAIEQYKTIIKGIMDDLNSYGYLKVTELVKK